MYVQELCSHQKAIQTQLDDYLSFLATISNLRNTDFPPWLGQDGKENTPNQREKDKRTVKECLILKKNRR